MPNRRTVILGMATVAFGSGAMAMNAAFEESVDPGSDFRVVAARDLTVAPGISFRDGTDPDDAYNASFQNEDGMFFGENHDDFFDNVSPTGGQEETLGTDLTVNDLPAITVNDNEDGSLQIKFAVLNTPATTTFTNAIQVTNDGSQTEEVGVKFQEFGVDTNGDQDNKGGTISESAVVDAISFKDESSTRISTDSTHFDGNTINSVSDQQVDNTVTIGPESTEQITIEIELDSSIVTDIASASEASGNPFTGDGHDTVQLVDTVRVGADPNSTTS